VAASKLSATTQGDGYVPAAIGVGAPPRAGYGDLEAGFAAAERIVEADYVTPAQFTTPWSRTPSSPNGTATT